MTNLWETYGTSETKIHQIDTSPSSINCKTRSRIKSKQDLVNLVRLFQNQFKHVHFKTRTPESTPLHPFTPPAVSSCSMEPLEGSPESLQSLLPLTILLQRRNMKKPYTPLLWKEARGTSSRLRSSRLRFKKRRPRYCYTTCLIEICVAKGSRSVTVLVSFFRRNV